MRSVVFVAPFPMETTMRFARAVAKLAGVKLLGVFQSPPVGADAALFTEIARVDNCLDVRQLLHAVGTLGARHGRPHRVLGVLENMQVQLAQVREHFGIPGERVSTVTLFRDKHRMKDALRAAGLPCARHRMVGTAADAWDFVKQVGFPLVLKPPAGAGCKATYRIANAAELSAALVEIQPNPGQPVLAEEFLTGDEHSFETITLRGVPRFYSISRYYPTPLEVMENPWIQWVCLLPREISGPEYNAVRAVGAATISALGLHTGMTHMEWFRRPNGTVAIGEIAQRPPGAQIVRLMSYAYDTDLYQAWARAVVDDAFDGPWERRYSVGAAFLRGAGEGRVARIEGLDEAQRKMGHLVVETQLPRIGAPKSDSYEGDGFAIVRHPDTEVVKRALLELIRSVRVVYAP